MEAITIASENEETELKKTISEENQMEEEAIVSLEPVFLGAASEKCGTVRP